MQNVLWALAWFGGAGLIMVFGVNVIFGLVRGLEFPTTVFGVAAVVGLAGLFFSKAPSRVVWVRANLKLVLGILFTGVLSMIGYLVITDHLSGRAADRKVAEDRCVRFINDEFNSGSRHNPAFHRDTWSKDGSIVVEVGWKETRSSSSYTTRLCVYDRKNQRLRSPGAFDRHRWE